MIGNTDLENLTRARNYLNLYRSDLAVGRRGKCLCIAGKIQLLAVVRLNMADDQDKQQYDAAGNSYEVIKLFLFHSFLLLF